MAHSPASRRSWVSLFGVVGIGVLDNVSRVDRNVSDAMCRVVTGDTIEARKLHSDLDIISAEVRRPLVVNGIEITFMEGDLSQRTIVLTLKTIAEGKHRSEGGFWGDYAEVRPQLFGAVLDDLVHVLATPAPEEIPHANRMTDFCETVAKLDALHSGDNNSLLRWKTLRSQHAATSIDGDPVWGEMHRQILSLHGGAWNGTCAELFLMLDAVRPTGHADRARADQWPSSAKVLEGRLPRALTFLRSAGWLAERVDSKVAKRAATYKLVVPGGPGNALPAGEADETDAVEKPGSPETKAMPEASVAPEAAGGFTGKPPF